MSILGRYGSKFGMPSAPVADVIGAGTDHGPVHDRATADFLASLRRQGLLRDVGHSASEPSAGSVEALWRSGAITADALATALAEFCSVPRAAFEVVSERAPAYGDLSRRYLRDVFAFPFRAQQGIALAMADPTRTDVVDALSLALGTRPEVCVLSFEDMEQLFERSSDVSAIDDAPAVGAGFASEPATSDDSLQDLARGAPIVKLIDEILERAIELSATDIHFEAERDRLRVRYRVDGQLRLDRSVPLATAPALISRVKIIAGLDISDRRMPQDGRANLRIGNLEADLRVAVMPSMNGENAVVRVLVKDTRLLELNRIGMSAADQAVFRALLSEPNGMVVVTGPTGSGKTTTLATAISLLNDPSLKIVTVEDPIEYQITGIHQTQIKPAIGLTFAVALRSFLRHNPDVIMVGEMRDRETVAIGIQAALTGHLLLTTLHTNSASDAVVRLLDMGVEPYLLGASLRGVVGQRLVRKLCERCKTPDERGPDVLAEMVGMRMPQVDVDRPFYAARGCSACGNTGYRGRLGIFEVMRTDETILSQIRAKADPARIVALAREGGMTLMAEDGLAKCADGLTSIEEVLRATG